MSTVLGTPITRETANSLINQHAFIKGLTGSMIDNTLKDPTNASILNGFENASVKWFKHFYNKVLLHFGDRENAYVFSREAVLRFFFEDSQLPTLPYPANRAEYLMVLTTSQYESSGGLIEGKETIVIAGCNDNSGGAQTSFTTLPLAKPATEHPPKRFESRLPPPLVAVQQKFNSMLEEMHGLSGEALEKKLIEFKKEIAHIKIPKEILDDDSPVTIDEKIETLD